MSEKPPKNSKHFDALALSVAAGCTIKAAAEDAGCSIGIAYAISRTDDFRQRVSEIRTEAMFAMVGILSDGAAKAARTIIELLDVEDDKIRLAAATRLLSSITPLSELHELRRDIAELKAQLRPKLATA